MSDPSKAPAHNPSQPAPATNPRLTAALELQALGWSIIPLCHPDHKGFHYKNHLATCTRPGKQPTVRWKARQVAAFTADQLRAHFDGNPTHNLGVVTGRLSGIVMVDIDDQAGERYWRFVAGDDATPTWEFGTGRKGRHLVYRWSNQLAGGGNPFPRQAGHIDYLGEGRQSVLPPSLHQTHALYDWTAGGPGSGMPIAPAPAGLIAAVRDNARKTRRPGGGGGGSPTASDANARQVKRARADLMTPCEAVSGSGGHNQTFKLACRLVHGYGLSVDQAFDLMLQVWNPRLNEPWKEEELRRKVEEAKEKGRYDPIPEKPARSSTSSPATRTATRSTSSSSSTSSPAIAGELARNGPIGNGPDGGNILAGESRSKQPGNLSFKERALLASTSDGAKATPTRPAQTQPAISMATGLSLKTRTVEYLWPGYIARGSLTIIDGRKGVGKSTLLVAIAADVTGGPRLPGTDQVARVLGTVLWFAGEGDVCSETKPRLALAKADMGRILFPGTDDDGRRTFRFQIKAHLGLIRKTIEESKAALMVVDPWVSLLDTGLSSNSEQDVRSVLEPLQNIGIETGCAIVMTRHLRKGGSGPAIDQGLGSTAIGNVARAVLLVDRHPQQLDGRILAAVACNIGPTPESLAFHLEREGVVSRVVWDGVTGHDADQLVGEGDDPGERDCLGLARQLLRTRIGNGWAPSKSINSEAEDAGIGTRALRQARAELKPQRRRVGGLGDAGWWEFGPPVGGWPPEDDKKQ